MVNAVQINFEVFVRGTTTAFCYEFGMAESQEFPRRKTYQIRSYMDKHLTRILVEAYGLGVRLGERGLCHAQV